MKVYIRKIDKQCIEKQMSYTKEILREFLGDLSDHGKIICEGKTTKEKVTVTLLLATDPRFDNNIQRLLKMEGNLAIGDLMVMCKVGSKYIVELVKPTDARHASYSELFGNDRHVLLEADNIGLDDKTEYSDVFNRNLFGIHIKLPNDALSETNPHICIGWSGMGDLSTITTKEDLSARYEATWPNEKVRKKGQDIGQIWRFVKEMQIGDYVVFANGDTCHIGKITSDYYFDNSANANQDDDYVNIRDMEWLKKDIRKSDLSEVFQNSLGAAMSVFRLNDYKSAVNDLLNDTYVKDELLLEEIE